MRHSQYEFIQSQGRYHHLIPNSTGHSARACVPLMEEKGPRAEPNPGCKYYLGHEAFEKAEICDHCAAYCTILAATGRRQWA